MFGSILKKIVGSKNERELKLLWPLVDQINAHESGMIARSDAELAELTPAFKKRLDAGESLDDILPEAFAAVREAARRTIGQRHYDVQLIGGVVLHQGKISEMKTGEGKTLSATLPVYLNALTGRGVHVVTVNDYLAGRDAEWMGAIYRFLGLKVGCILNGMDDVQRQEAYGADITYGTNSEFGFDYLRDNMKFEAESLVQRPFYYAIVDEVDSILIDEARTPLIISGPAEQATPLYKQANNWVKRLKMDVHFTVDEENKNATLTEEGIATCEHLAHVDNLYDPNNRHIITHIQQALRAHNCYKRDVEYMVQDRQVVIIDEFTGRLMPGRRFSEGLHQALEAKEGMPIKRENQTLASITYQNYFRMYEKLAGMTGTADTEAEEFHKIYKLEVVVIPTHRPMVRKDHPDVIFRSENGKYQAVLEEIKELHATGRPVLVGTISVDKSELLSKWLKRAKVTHEVLNAKNHAREAEIVAKAGQMGSVTISTNMAGRGTDIVLGQGVPELGGLHILGTERHESRRIDNQLRGRAGRQGDNGSSRFYLSLEDDLMRLFGSDRMTGIMDRVGMDDTQPIAAGLVSRVIENSQSKVEGRNFDIRKQLLEYDDVLNQQREVIYEQRRMALTGEGVHEAVLDMIQEMAASVVGQAIDPAAKPEDWDLDHLARICFHHLGILPELPGDLSEFTPDELEELLAEAAIKEYESNFVEPYLETMLTAERQILLSVVDELWKGHLLNMDHLKEGVGLRGYGQKDPLREYQREGYEMFNQLIESIKSEAVMMLTHIEIADKSASKAARAKEQDMNFLGGKEAQQTTQRREGKKISRNAPCPCGSGKKYKHCCARK
jgi:preprotein translocase subunit SecA